MAASSVLVIILQGETKACDPNISNLQAAFSDPYFTVQVLNVGLPPSSTSPSSSLTYNQYVENYQMRKALDYAAEGPFIDGRGTGRWSSYPVIIIKDSSVTNVSASGFTDRSNPNYEIGGMRSRIQNARGLARNADLYFLTVWNDACERYVDIETSVDRGSGLAWTLKPTSTQAVMYTPSSRDFIREQLVTSMIPLSNILNNTVGSGQLLATAFVPNIIDYDINLAVQNSDFYKLNQCAAVTDPTNSTSNVSSLLWFAVIVGIIILTAYILVVLGPWPQTKSN